MIFTEYRAEFDEIDAETRVFKEALRSGLPFLATLLKHRPVSHRTARYHPHCAKRLERTSKCNVLDLGGRMNPEVIKVEFEELRL